MSIPRFHIEDLSADRLSLFGDEARHAARARRVQPGERVALFDGRGGEAVGTVAALGRGHVEIVVESRRCIDRLPGPRLTLAVAPPKGPRGDWLIEKATELGVAAVWPLRTQRGEVEPGSGRVERWRRIALEAGKQSGRTFFMEVAEPVELSTATARAAEFSAAWLADPGGIAFDAAILPGAAAAAQRHDLALVGPEGGWTDDERRQSALAGLQPIRIAEGILRIETAAVALAALWAARRAGVARAPE